jgi:hypothetical protein
LARQAVRRLPLPLSAIPRGGPPFPTNLSMPIGGDLLCIQWVFIYGSAIEPFNPSYM